MPFPRQIRIIIAVALTAMVAGCSTTTELPKSDAQTFAIGAVLPLTGLHGASGRAQQRGLDLAVDEVNAAGGVNGRKLALTVLDSQSDLNAGRQAAALFRASSASVLLLGETSLVAALGDDLASYPQLLGFMCDYVPVPSTTPKNGVRIYLNGDQEGRAIEGYLAATDTAKAIIVYLNDPSGQSYDKYMEFLALGDQISPQSETYSRGEQNFRPLAAVLQRTQNSALVLAGEGPEYPRIIGAFDAVGWKGPVLGYVSDGNLAPMAGPAGLAATAIYPEPDFAVNPRATEAGRAFADKFHAKYGEEPTLPAAYAYDNIHALAAAAQSALSLKTEEIRKSFIGKKSYIGAAGPYSIKDDGDTEMPLRLVYANGQPAPPPAKSTIQADVTNVIPPASKP